MTKEVKPPAWLQDFEYSLPIRSQYAFAGNLHDVFLVPGGTRPVHLSLVATVWEVLDRLGYGGLVVFNPAEGLHVFPDSAELKTAVQRLLETDLATTTVGTSRASLAEWAGRIVNHIEPRLGLVLEDASRLVAGSAGETAAANDFLTAFRHLAQTARPRLGPEGKGPMFNPVIWLLDKENDLPAWYTRGTESVRMRTIPMPDYDDRRASIRILSRGVPDFESTPADQRDLLINQFADMTGGLTLRAVNSITQLAAARGIPFREIADAVRLFQLGVVENPWKGEYLKERILAAESVLDGKVLGQRIAVRKTLDILQRTVTGMTGAHQRGHSTRPRGVLFFAGPTGVGKTELAKAITEQLFGNERAYIRFDMSEFSAEHSDARLLGAPPGYVGYDAGGELTNALRERPFCLILFDEIEKAHERILDKFLQILDDGRITDGRGNTVYFTESIIVFTSNLGVSESGKDGERIQIAKPGTPYPELEKLIRGAIRKHFFFKLGRPEILNRIGDNIVVFDFISPEIGKGILNMMLGNVKNCVRDIHGLDLQLDPEVEACLAGICLADLEMGGRGIGNRLETAFVNPLARALFRSDWTGKSCARVKSLELRDSIYWLELE